MQKYADLYDQEYAKLTDALDNRWQPDDSIPSASAGFDYEGGPIWLTIELGYTGDCSSPSNNPCKALVNELVRIVFANYGHVNELEGIRFIIGKRAHELHVAPEDIIFQESRTIEEWRSELSTVK